MVHPSLQLAGYGPLVFDHSLPVSWKGRILPGARVFYYEGSLGTVALQEYREAEWCIRYTVFRFPKRIVLQWTEEHTLRFRFVLQGNVQFRGEEKKYKVREGAVNMLWAPGRRTYATVRGGEEYIILHVEYTRGLARQLLPRFPEGLSPEQKSTPIEKKWQDAIHEMMEAPYEGRPLGFFFENRVRDVLLYVLSQPGTGNRFEGLTKEEVEKIRQVDRLILEDLDHWHNVAELAKMVAMSQFKLKLAYLRVMGMSMFERFRQAKLEKGRRLLLETDHQIKLIYRMAGYKSVSGFEDAFKEKYGLLPLKYRKKYQPREMM
ncbi:MAG: helix-turn-helix domain-containing protein [Flavisolibacter sp.]